MLILIDQKLVSGGAKMHRQCSGCIYLQASAHMYIRAQFNDSFIGCFFVELGTKDLRRFSRNKCGWGRVTKTRDVECSDYQGGGGLISDA